MGKKPDQENQPPQWIKNLTGKRTVDQWNEDAARLGDVQGSTANNYLRDIGQRRDEGVSAEREKFIHGMYTDSHKVLHPNKDD